MRTRRNDIAPGVYLLAGHLTQAINAGHDLLGMSLTITEPTASMGPRMLRNREARLQRFVGEARRLEASVLAHILQGRRLVRELGRARGHLKLALLPFLAGTTPLLDAVTASADADARHFDGGTDPLAYARSRGLLAEDQGALMPVAEMLVDDGFRIAGQVPVGPLIALCDALLRALSLHFGLDVRSEDEDAMTEPLLPEPELRASEPAAGHAPDLSDQLARVRLMLALPAMQPEADAASQPHREAADGDHDDAEGASMDAVRPVSLLAALAEVRAATTPAE